MAPTRPRPSSEAGEVPCEACGRTTPRAQTIRCASCRRRVCRACARWYGHFMLVCEDCRASDW